METDRDVEIQVARGVTRGVLVAAVWIAVVLIAGFIVWQLVAANDGLECETENANRVLEGGASTECPE